MAHAVVQRRSHRFLRGTVQKLSAELDGNGRAWVADRVDAPANTLTCFEHDEVCARLRQLTRSGQTGSAGTHDYAVMHQG